MYSVMILEHGNITRYLKRIPYRVTKAEKNALVSIKVICRPYTNKSDKSLKKVDVCISNSNSQFLLVFM